jgi:hypothetical protein
MPNGASWAVSDKALIARDIVTMCAERGEKSVGVVAGEVRQVSKLTTLVVRKN